jgi:hypothetical protein
VAWEERDGSVFNIYVQRFTGSSWVNVGSALSASSAANSSALDPSLALDSSGNPVVAWREFDGTSYNIYVQRFTGSSWVNVGSGVLTGSSDANNPSLSLDSSGNPVVAWVEYDGTSYNLYLQQFNGSSWVKVGTTPLDISLNNRPYYPSLSLVNGSLSVAWREEGDLYVKRYLKNSFRPLGEALDAVITSNALDPSATLDNNNNPVVAWSETGDFSSGILVSRWASNTWNRILFNAAVNTFNNAYEPSLAVEKSTNVNTFVPVVAFSEEISPDQNNIYVRRSTNGINWSSYGDALDTTISNYASQPSLALDSTNQPYVAWVEIVNGSPNIYVKRWTGTAWDWAGSAAALDMVIGNDAGPPSLAIGSDNIPVIAWAEDNGLGNRNIYVKRLVSNTWTLVGTTAIDRAIANDASTPSLDLDSSNNPIVAWKEFVSASANSGNLYVKRWNGSSWVLVGNIIDKVATNQVSSPSLSVGTNDSPVVSWNENENNNSNIYVKRWNSTTSRWVLVSSGALDNVLAQNAYRPSMVLNATNNPIVAWQETTSSNQNNVYVKRF